MHADRFRRSPVIEGEKLPESVRVERDEKFHFRFWSPICWGDFVFLYRKKKLKFKVRREPQIFLKLGWLKAWQQGLHDPQEAAETAKEKSQDLILLLPKILSLIFGFQLLVYLVAALISSLFADSVLPLHMYCLPILFLLSSCGCFYSHACLRQRNRLGLWICPAMIGIFYTAIVAYAIWGSFRYSSGQDDVTQLVLSLWGTGFGVLLYASFYYLPYRQLKRLDHQIQETQGKDDLLAL